MTKKILALIMAGLISCSAAATTFADEVTEVDYTMIDESVYEGTWVTCFSTFDVYLPSDWNVLVNEEVDSEPENGVYFSAASEDETSSVAVSYAPSEYDDIYALAEVYAAQDGFESVEVVVVNGIECVSYESTVDGVWTAGLVALGDQGGIYNVTAGCTEDTKDDFKPVALNIMLSFSATEEGDEADYEEAEEDEDEEAEEDAE